MDNYGDSLPAYMRIRRKVLDQISRSNGKFEKLPSVSELCEIHKASRPTVVKALKQLRDEGHLIARRGLGMFANPGRQTKRYGIEVGRPEGVVGLIASGGTQVHYTTYHLNMINGISGVLADSGYNLQIINTSSSDKDILKELEPFRIDGLIWIHAGEAAGKATKTIDKSKIPLVTIPTHENNFSRNYVATKFYDSGYIATDYLLNLGHRDIIYLCLPLPNCNGLEVEGAKQAYSDHGLDSKRYKVIICKNNPSEKIETMLDLGVKFTAIKTPTEYYQYVMDTLSHRNVKVPEDCSVVTDFELSTQNLKNPKPTLFASPLREMGARATKGLIEIIEGRRKKPLNIIMKRILIEGETTAPPPGVKKRKKRRRTKKLN